MKVRKGFVSNSSSSSFVLLKGGLSEDTIHEFRVWVADHNREASEGYLEETKSTFLGQLDYHVDMPAALREKINTNVEQGD